MSADGCGALLLCVGPDDVEDVSGVVVLAAGGGREVRVRVAVERDTP